MQSTTRPSCSTFWPISSSELLPTRASDGALLACWDLAAGSGGDHNGTGVPLLLVHGAALHAHCWSPAGQTLATSGLRPLALDLRGHGHSDRSPRGDYSWELFASDILSIVAGLVSGEAATNFAAGSPAVGSPAVGHPAAGLPAVGHSAGASALLLAEAARPGTFSSLWLWEPITMAPGDVRREATRRAMAERARRRREHFASVEEARGHLEGRGMFAAFSEACFADFLSWGLVPDDDSGVRLACRGEDEASVYEWQGLPEVLAKLPSVGCPVRVVGGQLSDAVPPEVIEGISRLLPNGEAVVLPQLGHFGPFERPDVVAKDIEDWVLG